MLCLVFDALLLGVIIGLVEQDQRPGILEVGACLIVAVLSMWFVGSIFPDGFPILEAIVGLSTGFAVATLSINVMCDVPVKRAAISTGIWVAVEAALVLIFTLIT